MKQPNPKSKRKKLKSRKPEEKKVKEVYPPGKINTWLDLTLAQQAKKREA